MAKLEKSCRPLWRKSILQGLDIATLQETLYEIGEGGDYYGYDDDGSKGDYYEEYKPLFDELAMGAQDLQEALDRIEEYDINGECIANWDDFTVALLGGVKHPLGYDETEMDYFRMLDCDEDAAVREAEKRLERLTKRQLVENFRQVLTLLMMYVDIKGAYDTLNAVVCELDDRAAAMQDGKASERMYVE